MGNNFQNTLSGKIKYQRRLQHVTLGVRKKRKYENIRVSTLLCKTKGKDPEDAGVWLTTGSGQEWGRKDRGIGGGEAVILLSINFINDSDFWNHVYVLHMQRKRKGRRERGKEKREGEKSVRKRGGKGKGKGREEKERKKDKRKRKKGKKGE